MVEIDKRVGSSIKIDGVNIQEVGLHLLRSRIGIISQSPNVFTGSVRRNLDPLEVHSDEELWKVLQDVKLDEHLSKLKGLYTDMTVASQVFSVGQKQLMCLARAILQNTKIICLDESTAQVDHNTDQYIQAIVRERFDRCTIITIAHRLSTIAD